MPTQHFKPPHALQPISNRYPITKCKEIEQWEVFHVFSFQLLDDDVYTYPYKHCCLNQAYDEHHRYGIRNQ